MGWREVRVKSRSVEVGVGWDKTVPLAFKRREWFWDVFGDTTNLSQKQWSGITSFSCWHVNFSFPPTWEQLQGAGTSVSLVSTMSLAPTYASHREGMAVILSNGQQVFWTKSHDWQLSRVSQNHRARRQHAALLKAVFASGFWTQGGYSWLAPLAPLPTPSRALPS